MNFVIPVIPLQIACATIIQVQLGHALSEWSCLRHFRYIPPLSQPSHSHQLAAQHSPAATTLHPSFGTSAATTWVPSGRSCYDASRTFEVDHVSRTLTRRQPSSHRQLGQHFVSAHLDVVGIFDEHIFQSMPSSMVCSGHLAFSLHSGPGSLLIVVIVDLLGVFLPLTDCFPCFTALGRRLGHFIPSSAETHVTDGCRYHGAVVLGRPVHL